LARPTRCAPVQARLFEQAQFANKIPGIEVGDDHFTTVVVFDHDRHGAFDNEKQGLSERSPAQMMLLLGRIALRWQ
jgi:hypothetical protein